MSRAWALIMIIVVYFLCRKPQRQEKQSGTYCVSALEILLCFVGLGILIRHITVTQPEIRRMKTAFDSIDVECVNFIDIIVLGL
jgi:hypothetical protein